MKEISMNMFQWLRKRDARCPWKSSSNWHSSEWHDAPFPQKTSAGMIVNCTPVILSLTVQRLSSWTDRSHRASEWQFIFTTRYRSAFASIVHVNSYLSLPNIMTRSCFSAEFTFILHSKHERMNLCTRYIYAVPGESKKRERLGLRRNADRTHAHTSHENLSSINVSDATNTSQRVVKGGTNRSNRCFTNGRLITWHMSFILRVGLLVRIACWSFFAGNFRVGNISGSDRLIV